MADTALQTQVLRFGTFELDLAAGELRKNGRKVRLQEQPFQFLAALIEKPGEVVTREELKDKLWPGDTYVDFDRSLNTAASKLREALGDSASSPRFVETLPRRGYRFLASVEPVGGLPTNGTVADFPHKQVQPLDIGGPTPRRTTRAGWYVAAGVLAAVAGIGAWWMLQPTPEAPLTPVPLTSYQGIERHPTFSPDGNEFAFAWDGGGDNSDIYRKLIGPGEPLPLTTHPADEYAPAWSPDGKHIAFFRDLENERVGLFLIPGVGRPRNGLLLEKSAAKYGIDRLAWSPDSKWLVFSRRGHGRLPLRAAPSFRGHQSDTADHVSASSHRGPATTTRHSLRMAGGCYSFGTRALKGRSITLTFRRTTRRMENRCG